MPIDGVSMTYTWDDAKAPTHRATQLFEMFGNRGIYHDGWMASTTPLVFAWEPEPKGITPESFNWELYDLQKTSLRAPIWRRPCRKSSSRWRSFGGQKLAGTTPCR